MEGERWMKECTNGRQGSLVEGGKEPQEMGGRSSTFQQTTRTLLGSSREPLAGQLRHDISVNSKQKARTKVGMSIKGEQLNEMSLRLILCYMK